MTLEYREVGAKPVYEEPTNAPPKDSHYRGQQHRAEDTDWLGDELLQRD
jgi:hypothetical protein